MKYVCGIAAYQKVRNKKLKCVFCYILPVDTMPNIRVEDDIDSGMKYIEFYEKEIFPDTVQFLNVRSTDVYLEIVGFKPPFFKYESAFYKITGYDDFVEYGELNWKYYGHSSKYVLRAIAKLDPESKEVIREMEEQLTNRVHKIIVPDVNKEEEE